MNAKQMAFVREYLIDLNATQAAIRAGYSEATAYSQGERLLRHVEVAAAISAGQSERAHRLEITADRVALEYARIAFANVGDVLTFGPDGVTVRDMADLSPDQLAAVAEVSETKTQTGGTVRVKLHDKIAALTALAKQLGMNAPEKVAMTSANGDDRPVEPTAAARALLFALAKVRNDLEAGERTAAH